MAEHPQHTRTAILLTLLYYVNISESDFTNLSHRLESIMTTPC